MKRATFILGLIGTFFWVGCDKTAKNSADKHFEIPTNGYAVKVEASGSEKVDALVRQLVSQRPAPYRSGYSDPPVAVVFATRYCTPEVDTAFKYLRELGPAAFPSLVKHLGDDRYSYSDVGEAWENHRVGDAIVEILDDGYYMHSGYKWRKTPSGSGGRYISFDDYLMAKGAEAWAEWAKSRSRLEIQIDFIDWCISKENERGFVDETQKKQIIQIYESARGRVKKEYSEQKGTAN